MKNCNFFCFGFSKVIRHRHKKKRKLIYIFSILSLIFKISIQSLHALPFVAATVQEKKMVASSF